MQIGDKLLPNHSFLVAIGQDIFSFSKVSNLASQVEYETVAEGGNNDYPLLFRKQKKTPDTLTLEKGVCSRSSDSAFNALREGMQVEMVTVMLVKDDSELQKVFYFKKGLIVKRTFSNLDAMGQELLIETLEIAHSGLIEISLS